MSDKEINAIVQENLEAYHSADDQARHKIISSICKKHDFDKTVLSNWFYMNQDIVNTKTVQSKFHAKNTRAFQVIESSLVQALDLLAKEGYDVTNAEFKNGKLKIKKID